MLSHDIAAHLVLTFPALWILLITGYAFLYRPQAKPHCECCQAQQTEWERPIL